MELSGNSTGDNESDESGKFVLYHHHHYRSTRCLWLIRELGVENDVRIITKKDKNYPQIHPHNTIPALQLPGQEAAMLESGAICLYLADLYKGLQPTESEKANYYNWILYACSSLDQWMEPLYLQWCQTDADRRDLQLIEENVSRVGVAMSYLNQHLSKRQFLCGDRLTAADCVLGYNIWWAGQMEKGQLISGLAHVQAYLTRLTSRPAFQKTFASSP